MARVRNGAALAALAFASPFAGSAVAQVAPPAPVEQTSLASDAFATGVLSRADGALAADRWKGADPARLITLLADAPSRPSGPAIGAAMRLLLLSPSETPPGAGPALGGAKLAALARAGFLDEARTIASLSGAPASQPLVAEALAIADLNEGMVDAACRRAGNLASGRQEPFWIKLRLVCYAAAGERDAADLTFGLLRDRGLLSDADEALFNAVIANAAPKTPVAPENALHLAAARLSKQPLGPGLLAAADGGVLKGLVRDADQPAATRVAAAWRATAMGAMGAADLAALYESLPAEPAAIAGAPARARTHADDPMTDVLLYKSVAQMSAPEFLRDKAARIAEALAVADSFPRAYAAALVYAADIRALDGALVTPAEAARFAEARMAIGDGAGAARWLRAMLGSDGLPALPEEEAMAFIALTDLLAALDPEGAAGLAERAGVALDATTAPLSAGAMPDPERFPGVVEAAFEAAMKGIPGEAGLAALAASDAAPPGDPVGDVVVGQSLRAAGLDALRARLRFESAWRSRFAVTPTSAPAAGAAAAAEPAAASSPAPAQRGLLPRLKPRSSP